MPENRRAARAEITLPCTLRRPIGRPIVAQTVNVGGGGMLVSTARPLTVDEPLSFDLANLDVPVHGHARVLRQQRHDMYALRFEGLPPPLTNRLRELAVQAGQSPAA
jgi:PilZ domain